MRTRSLDLHSALIGRTEDLEYVRGWASAGACCSLVGVSNLGKSAVMRKLCTPQEHAEGTFVYVDCNEMPERSARAFFTATWNALSSALETGAPPNELRAQAQQRYAHMVATPSAAEVTWLFDEGLALALDKMARPLVLCFDEFDEPYDSLEAQAFLNLRALKDRHGGALAYVTATERELARLTSTRERSEFYELITPRVRFVAFWEAGETRAFCEHHAACEYVSFDASDLAFIREQAGGHPGLVQAVCYALGAVTGAPVRDAQQNQMIHQLVARSLSLDDDVQAECAKIWMDLEPDEREALCEFEHAQQPSGHEHGPWRALRHKFIIQDGPQGARIFGAVFADYARRQHLMQQPHEHGVHIDVDAGAVAVDGKPIEPLTDLEYRLLLYLYGRIDRVCDKYGIVEAVWGQAYIDSVDDARIEKLISRVRQKIEPDPGHPRFLLSQRGRGYKLVR